MKLTRHWQTKLIALFLAVALWLYTSGQARMDKTVTVRVTAESVKSLPEAYRIVDIDPEEFIVVLDGPMGALRRFESGPVIPVLEISARALEKGFEEFPLTGRTLGLDPEVHIQSVHPDTLHDITVRFGRIVEDTLPVEEPKVTVPSGFDLGVTLSLSLVHVRGPQNAIADLKAQKAKLAFEPVSLEHLDPKMAEPTVQQVQLKPLTPPSVEVLEAVKATITVKPVTAATTVQKVPLELMVPPDFFKKYEVDLPLEVALSVSGPQNKIRDLRAGDLTAYVNLCKPLELNVQHDVEVRILAPPWLVYEPTTVRVALSLSAAKPVKTPEEQPRPPEGGER